MATPEEALRDRLRAVPRGTSGWKQFEDAAIAVLAHLFVPQLADPIIQARSYSGIDRRDAIFPNRNHGASNHWGRLLHELDARMILVEFKNYDTEEIGKDEVNQTRNYLTKPLGRLALIVSTKKPNHAAHLKRNSVYSEDGKVIVFLTVEHLDEMLYMKERGEDPADLITDLVERFYIEWE
ncbi:hypothetical protein HCN08_24390 [Streptomyces sp. PRB2-1]|uniref:Restriction endonuclease n=2 Tax=Actinacidiphila epipremni TaxID=2053013 RepID=A0ABX0ZRE9_9ACTN|nr:hypothetical protein [Actinacidiphila epipremni]